MTTRGFDNRPGWREVAADYPVLVAELEAAAAGALTTYAELFVTAARFAPALAGEIHMRQDHAISIDDTADGFWTFASLGRVLGTPLGELAAANLTNPAVAETRALDCLKASGDVFGGFAGRWRGAWHSRSVQGIQHPADTYDHDWQPTRAEGALGIQRVVMGLWAGRGTPDQGIDSEYPIAAVNAIDPRTGRITGAVGLGDGHCLRPHIGYFIDTDTLLWVAQERPPDATTIGSTALYSCFFEHLTPEDRYQILGIQFTWTTAPGIAGTLAVTQLMGGVYTHPC